MSYTLGAPPARTRSLSKPTRKHVGPKWMQDVIPEGGRNHINNLPPWEAMTLEADLIEAQLGRLDEEERQHAEEYVSALRRARDKHHERTMSTQTRDQAFATVEQDLAQATNSLSRFEEDVDRGRYANAGDEYVPNERDQFRRVITLTAEKAQREFGDHATEITTEVRRLETLADVEEIGSDQARIADEMERSRLASDDRYTAQRLFDEARRMAAHGQDHRARFLLDVAQQKGATGTPVQSLSRDLQARRVEGSRHLQRAARLKTELKADRARFDARLQGILADANVQPRGTAMGADIAAEFARSQKRNLDKGGDGSLQSMGEMASRQVG